MKILMKIRKLASIPLRTDDRDAPLVVGTPRSEQVAKKTENAANATIKTDFQSMGRQLIFMKGVFRGFSINSEISILATVSDN